MQLEMGRGRPWTHARQRRLVSSHARYSVRGRTEQQPKLKPHLDDLAAMQKKTAAPHGKSPTPGWLTLSAR